MIINGATGEEDAGEVGEGGKVVPLDGRRRKPKGYDAFSLSSVYGVDKFYTEGVDDKGHSGGQRRVSFPPDILGRMDKLVLSKQFPYDTFQHFLRDAAIHRMQYLSSQLDDGEALGRLRMHQIRAQMEQHRREGEADAKFVEDAREALRHAVNGKDLEKLSGMLEDLSIAMEEITEPYRVKQLKELQEYYSKERSHLQQEIGG